MSKKKIVDKEMKTPTVKDAIYLSDGLYLLPNGDIIEQ